jgi:hypothetical protein
VCGWIGPGSHLALCHRHRVQVPCRLPPSQQVPRLPQATGLAALLGRQKVAAPGLIGLVKHHPAPCLRRRLARAQSLLRRRPRALSARQVTDLQASPGPQRAAALGWIGREPLPQALYRLLRRRLLLWRWDQPLLVRAHHRLAIGPQVLHGPQRTAACG